MEEPASFPQPMPPAQPWKSRPLFPTHAASATMEEPASFPHPCRQRNRGRAGLQAGVLRPKTNGALAPALLAPHESESLPNKSVFIRSVARKATHCSFAYSAFACFKAGTSASASFQSPKNPDKLPAPSPAPHPHPRLAMFLPAAHSPAPPPDAPAPQSSNSTQCPSDRGSSETPPRPAYLAPRARYTSPRTYAGYRHDRFATNEICPSSMSPATGQRLQRGRGIFSVQRNLRPNGRQPDRLNLRVERESPVQIFCAIDSPAPYRPRQRECQRRLRLHTLAVGIKFQPLRRLRARLRADHRTQPRAAPQSPARRSRFLRVRSNRRFHRSLRQTPAPSRPARHTPPNPPPAPARKFLPLADPRTICPVPPAPPSSPRRNASAYSVS